MTSEVVFVGYGVEAPEYGWDDYKGVDVARQDARDAGRTTRPCPTRRTPRSSTRRRSAAAR